MFSARRPLGRGLLCFLALVLLALPAAAQQQKPRIEVNDYQIDAELQPRVHKIVAQAKVKFTALDDISVATFELHNALRPTRVTGEDGKQLNVERVSSDSSIRIELPNGLAKGQTTTLTISYEGSPQSPDDSPVQGLKLTAINDDTTYLLYAGRWFPVSGYGINRFTATMHITVPADEVVIASGAQGTAAATATPAAEQTEEPKEPEQPKLTRGRKAKPAPAAPPARASVQAARGNANAKTFTFVWDKPSFPGTVIAGRFEVSTSNAAGLNLRLYFKPAHKDQFGAWADTATREFQYYAARLGPPLSNALNIVEIPDDTVPATWAPEIVGISSRNLAGKINYRLLANQIAHQWWGAGVSPATKADWWISDGFARYSEARFVEFAAGTAAFDETMKDLDVGALAYDTVPLSQIGRLDTFSPEFQSLTSDKGAVILNMLRWVMGDAAFDKSVQAFFRQYDGKSATIDDFRQIAEQSYGDKLSWFFTQWLDSTGAPEFKNKFTVYRVGDNKGFRVVGEIQQDLDLFRMPVELKIDTDGKTETKRIEVVGTDSAYTVETFGKPRRIVIDPGDRVLKNSPDIKLRAAILRGQGLVQQGDLAEALEQFQKALEINKNSSLAHYRIAEVFFLQHNYQAAANAYRESLNGDDDPRWTEVWSHIQLGKIFDITQQRDRAVNEYRQALQTNDNTQGAMDEARRYLNNPYQQERAANQ